MLDVEYKKKSVRVDSRAIVLSRGKDGVAVNRGGAAWRLEVSDGGQKFILDTLRLRCLLVFQVGMGSKQLKSSVSHRHKFGNLQHINGF